MAVATGQHPADDLAACGPDLLFADFADVPASLARSPARHDAALVVLWLHVLGAVVWIGGLAYQAHVLLPAARRGGTATFADVPRRARPVTWTAIALVVLTGLLQRHPARPLERVMESGAGLPLAAKFMLVLVAVALAGQRDFAQVPRLSARPRRRRRPRPALAAIALAGSRRAAAGGRDRLPRPRRLPRLIGRSAARCAAALQRPVILIPEFFSL